MLGSNCKFTACLLESFDISNLDTVSLRAGLLWVVIHFALLLLIFHAVPIALHKKKHGYETKKEKVVFIPPTLFIVTDLANSDISNTLTLLNIAQMHLQSMKTERLRIFRSSWKNLVKGKTAEKCQLKEERLVNAQ